MIVMGYPGIGKSTYARKRGSHAIDLESSLFNKDFATYVDVALDLEKQGYIVFVSCHEEVRQALMDKASFLTELAVCYPDPSLEIEWEDRLLARIDKYHLDKDVRAYVRFTEHFIQDIQDIESPKFSSFRKLKLTKPKYKFREQDGPGITRNLVIDY